MPYVPETEPTTRKKRSSNYVSEPYTESNPSNPQEYASGGSDLQHDIAKVLGVGDYRPGEHDPLRSTLTGPSGEYEQRGYERGFYGLDQSEQARKGQSELIRALQMQAAGIGPSLAQQQLQQAMERSQAAAQSQIASARGLSPAQAQQLALRQQAGSRAAMGMQSAQLRLAEQAQKQQELAQVLGQQRGQDITGAGVAGGMGEGAGKIRQTGEIEAMNQANKEAETTRKVAGGVLEGLAGAATMFAHGSEIKGRAKFKGDTRANDTVPAMLSPGEIVLPRSVAQDADAPDKAREFVAALKKKQKTTPKDFSQALTRLRELEARLDAMESLNDLEAESEDD